MVVPGLTQRAGVYDRVNWQFRLQRETLCPWTCMDEIGQSRAVFTMNLCLPARFLDHSPARPQTHPPRPCCDICLLTECTLHAIAFTRHIRYIAPNPVFHAYSTYSESLFCWTPSLRISLSFKRGHTGRRLSVAGDRP